MPSPLFIRVLGVFLGLISHLAVAQRPSVKSDEPAPQVASLAVRTGLALMFGDLADPLSTPFVGASLIVPITKIVSIELPFDCGILRSQQPEYYHSLAKTPFWQASLVASADVLKGFGSGHKRTEVRPYAGAGLIFFRAEAYDFTTGKLQRQTNAAGSHRSRDGVRARGKAGVPRTHELAIPLGLRVATALGRRVSIFGDVRFNLIRTDKLDATLDGNNQVMKAGSSVYTEGNHYGQNSQDKWGYLSVGLNVYFGERFK